MTKVQKHQPDPVFPEGSMWGRNFSETDLAEVGTFANIYFEQIYRLMEFTKVSQKFRCFSTSVLVNRTKHLVPK